MRLDSTAAAANTIASAKKTWRFPLLLAVALRGAYSGAAALFALVLPWDPQLVYSNLLAETAMRPERSLRYALLGVWQRFDTLWYLHIAREGYSRPEAVVFYPLYPVLIRVVGWLVNPTAAALLISTIGAFFTFWGIQRLLELDLPDTSARDAVLLLAVWPGSFILFAAYPESLVIAAVAWSIYFARTGRWTHATLIAIAAALAKAVGAIVLVPLLLLAWRQRSRRSWKLAALLPAVLAYPAWLRVTGRYSAASAYAAYWHTRTVAPWVTLWDAVRLAVTTHDALLLLNIAVLTLFVVLVFVGVRRLEYLLYSAAAFAVFLTKYTDPLLQSTMRYVLVIFPAFIIMQRVASGGWAARRFRLLCVALAALNLTGLWLFLKWSLVF
jgi:hypothetical protein